MCNCLLGGGGAHRIIIDMCGALRATDVCRDVCCTRQLAARLAHLRQVRLLAVRRVLALRALVDAGTQAAAKQ